ncbi:hypothetical protein SAY87_023377 [Trapa incisa]|uniref:Uncharacterized protein n=1 Tax=Trapa incisa TaxID=236973 RepID=A0AAN7L647_9MYRT|nr:hypothetical protein SAY87_023377 [Trapa incisa]
MSASGIPLQVVLRENRMVLLGLIQGKQLTGDTGRGFLIRGWAPQLAILSYRSIWAFFTHCGWNSTLEGLCSGPPMITWSHFAELFVKDVALGSELWLRRHGSQVRAGAVLRDSLAQYS